MSDRGEVRAQCDPGLSLELGSQVSQEYPGYRGTRVSGHPGTCRNWPILENSATFLLGPENGIAYLRAWYKAGADFIGHITIGIIQISIITIMGLLIKTAMVP
eukprot:2848145-Rhodomonas_salina.1